MKERGSVFGYYFLFLWRIFLVYLLYTLSRGFFIILNYDILAPISFSQLLNIFFGGLLFDTSAILYSNILFIVLSLLPASFVFRPWYQRVVKIVYVFVNFLFLTVNLCDSVYFRFTMRRTTISFLSEFQGDVNIAKILLESAVMYWYVPVVSVCFLLILIFLSGGYNRIKGYFHSRMYYFATNYRPYLFQTLAIIVTLPVVIIGIRGGVTRTIKPINLSNAGDFVDKAIHTSAVLNTPFSIIRTLGKQYFSAQHFYDSYEAMESVYSPVHEPSDCVRDSLSLFPVTDEKMNVVIVILESFGARNMKFLNENLACNFTPFLDSVRRQGVLCTNAYANGRVSVDAVPSLLASIPSLMKSFAVSPYANNQVEGLPRILDSLGYYTAFFHGAPNNSMGIRAITNLCGVKNYYGKSEYGNNSDYDGSWGIWDHKFLPYVAKTISTFKEPFFVSVFTLSSHHPFKIHADFKGVFSKGDNPIQETIAYSDYSVGKFFNMIKDEPWFKNTIFILTPDHSTWSSSDGSFFTTQLGNTKIPIIYYSPGFIPAGEYDKPTQQIDIMPTVLGMLGYDKPYFAYGRDLASDRVRPFAVNFDSGEYQLVVGDSLYIMKNSELSAIYNYKTDSLLSRNLKSNDKSDNNYSFFQALIQQYTNRLIDDKLTTK